MVTGCVQLSKLTRRTSTKDTTGLSIARERMSNNRLLLVYLGKLNTHSIPCVGPLLGLDYVGQLELYFRQ